MPMKGSDLLVKALESEGVEYVFGIPGEENLDFLDALRRSPIRLVLTRHEQAAGFMAATYGRLTGKTGVCMSTLGPGATNFVTAAAYAQLGAMPMLMITGQKPIKSSKQGRFQVVDIVEMMKPLTKYTRQIVSAENVPACLREAIRLAEEERPGAVHLELPEDIERELTDEQPIPASAVRRPTAEKKSIERAVAMIEAARHPLLVIGAAANRQRTAERVRKIAFKYAIPFISTQMGKGVIDERSPRSLGTAALSNYDFLHRAIEHADLIVNIGHDVVEKPPFLMKPGGFEVIHVNFFTAAVDAVYFPQVEVVGDIATSVELVSNQLSCQDHWDFGFFEKVRGAVESHVREGTDDERFPIYPQRLVADVREVMPSDGVIALDNGVYKIWFARNYKAHEPNTVLLDNALATMGAGLPSAIAARLVCPERRVMAICGDGGFMMNSQELETAVRLKLDLVVLILRDDAYGMIKWKQAGLGFPEWGLDFGNPDFVRYAESYGAHGCRVESADHLLPLMEECHSTPGVHVIDCPVDYSDNDRILNREIREKSQAI